MGWGRGTADKLVSKANVRWRIPDQLSASEVVPTIVYIRVVQENMILR